MDRRLLGHGALQNVGQCRRGSGSGVDTTKDSTVKLYTIGYQGKDVNRLKEWLIENDGVLLDIRYSPCSNMSVWQLNNLVTRLKTRYLGVSAFGNKNYKGGPIEIANFNKGMNTLDDVRQQFSVGVLMCACRDYKHCHRRVVAERLRVLGYEVEELVL